MQVVFSFISYVLHVVAIQTVHEHFYITLNLYIYNIIWDRKCASIAIHVHNDKPLRLNRYNFRTIH